MKFLFCLFGVLGIVLLDQAVKDFIVQSLSLSQRIPLPGGLLTITHVRNYGAAYNLLSGYSGILIFVPGIIMLSGLVFLALWRNRLHPMAMTAAAMIIGGGAGNLVDRISKGYVVDFLDIRVIPVFNVADIFITAGCGLLVIYLLFFDGKQHAS